MTNIIQSSRGIDADNAIGSQPVFENATLAGAIQDLTRIACAFEQERSVPLSPRLATLNTGRHGCIGQPNWSKCR